MIESKIKKYDEYKEYLNGYIKEMLLPIMKEILNLNLVDTDLNIKDDIFNELFNSLKYGKSYMLIDFTELNDYLNDHEDIGWKNINDYELTMEHVKSFCFNKKIKNKLNIDDNVAFIPILKDENLKKIIKTTKISDYEVETPDGWVNIEALHETIEYQVYELILLDGKNIKCADTHIVMNSNNEEVFIKDLIKGDEIIVKDGTSTVFSVNDLGYKEKMYDLELNKNSNRVYFTNGVLSHNTFLAKVLAEHVFGDSDALIRVDMSEYMEKHSMSKLIGSPPGYIGYGEGGKLTEQVRNKPYSLILFDEVEKAHDDIFNLLLQLLDEGHITDSNGRKIDFKNTLIIMTSNIGVKELSQFGTSMGYETKNNILNEENRAKNIIKKALKKKFKPEFLNRIDDAIIFNSLKPEDISIIIKNEIDIVKDRILELGYNLEVDDTAMNFIAKEGYDKEYGARPLNRAIIKYVEDPIADEVMDGKLKDGGNIKINYSKEKGITTKIS